MIKVDQMENPKKIIIFANTLWFIEKFKFELISSLKDKSNVECLYLRNGPIIDQKKINFLKERNVKFKNLNLKYFLLRVFKNLSINSIKKEKEELRNIIVFNIGPIILSIIIFHRFTKQTIIVLEGLGRVFSSKLLKYRLLKRIITFIYKFIFSKCKYVLTLNYADANFLARMNIAPLSKIKTIPGTGIDTSYFKNQKRKLNSSPKFIDYIARIIPEKGIYDFIYMREYIRRYHKNIEENYQFRIITPQSDIDKFAKNEENFFKFSGINFKPYLTNPIDYYKDSKVIIMPTSYGEGLSRLLLESLYLEIPVLVTRNQGTEEILPYDYKYFIISQNPSILASQLLEMLEDGEYLKKTLFKQKNIIENFYSTQKSIEVFETFLN